MKSSDHLNEEIKVLKNSISDLQKRRLEIDEGLSDIKKDLANNLDDPDTEQRITELTSNREVIDEVISDKEQQIGQLEEQLKEAEAQEKKQAHFQKLVDLAKKADEAASEYRELVEELDHELMDKLITIAEKQRAWAQASSQFKSLAPQLEPAVEIKRNQETEKMSELEEASKVFVQSIEENGVSTDAVLSEIYVAERYFRMAKRNGRDIKPDTDNFGWAIYEMLDKVKKKLRKEADKTAA